MVDPLRMLAARALLSFFAAISVIVLFVYFDLIANTSAAAEKELTIGQAAFLLFGWVVFSPVVETLLLATTFKVASNYLPVKLSAVLAASSLAAMHGFIWWAWPIIVLVPFLIFSVPFVQHSGSIKSAIVSSVLTHGFHNFYGFLGFVAAHKIL